MRSTLYNVPCNQDMLKESQIPLAAVITPFASIPKDEVTEVYTVLEEAGNDQRGDYHPAGID